MRMGRPPAPMIDVTVLCKNVCGIRDAGAIAAARSVPIPALWPAGIWPRSIDGRPKADVSFSRTYCARQCDRRMALACKAPPNPFSVGQLVFSSVVDLGYKRPCHGRYAYHPTSGRRAG